MKRIVLKLSFVSVVTVMTALITGCDPATDIKEPELIIDPVYPPETIELTKAEQGMVNSSNEFAFNLFKQIRESTNLTMRSIVVSPISITYALGMLNNGAAGNTQAQINRVLGFSETGASGINDFCYKMQSMLPALDSLTKILIANTIYMNEGYELKPEFTQIANTYYNAYPVTRKFDNQTLDAINKWASDNTEQMIDKVLDERSFDPNAVSYLLNAIYFKGSWTYRFDKALTKPTHFIHAGDADVDVTCQMMCMNDVKLEYTQNEDYQAVRLPYGNGSFQMTILLPRKKKNEPSNGLPIVPTIETWNELNNAMDSVEITELKIPRLETETDIDLIPIMSALGMPEAFGTEADFSNFCNTSAYIGLMKQVAKIKLDEEGTEAAAVTVIGVKNTMGPQESVIFNADHPFLYFISERNTGTILFIGQCTGNGSDFSEYFSI